MNAKEGDICYLVADDWRRVVHVLGLFGWNWDDHRSMREACDFFGRGLPKLFEDVDDDGNPPRSPPLHHASCRRPRTSIE